MAQGFTELGSDTWAHRDKRFERGARDQLTNIRRRGWKPAPAARPAAPGLASPVSASGGVGPLAARAAAQALKALKSTPEESEWCAPSARTEQARTYLCLHCDAYTVSIRWAMPPCCNLKSC
jgi:hypothetical protein